MVGLRFLGWLTFALAGCGKLGFDALPDAAVDAPLDAAPDATGFSRVEIGTLSSTMNIATEVITFDNWIISPKPIGCP